MAASLSGPLRPPSKRAKAMPFPCQQVGEVIERLAVVDKDQLLLVRIAPQQVEQRRLLAAVADGRPALRQRVPARHSAWRAAKRRTRGGCRGRRRSGGAEQMVQREPVSAAPSAASRRAAAASSW